MPGCASKRDVSELAMQQYSKEIIVICQMTIIDMVLRGQKVQNLTSNFIFTSKFLWIFLKKNQWTALYLEQIFWQLQLLIKPLYFLKGSPIFDGSKVYTIPCSMLIYGQKDIYLILYPSLENLTTHIAMVHINNPEAKTGFFISF